MPHDSRRENVGISANEKKIPISKEKAYFSTPLPCTFACVCTVFTINFNLNAKILLPPFTLPVEFLLLNKKPLVLESERENV